jgi:hypothetical protein
MKYIKAFAVASAFPAFIMPFAVCLLPYFGFGDFSKMPFFNYLPFIWGMWNVAYYLGLDKLMPFSCYKKSAVYGALLGLLIAAYCVFFGGVSAGLGLSGYFVYAPLIIAPVIYGILWPLIVGKLNKAVGISCCKADSCSKDDSCCG